MTEHELFSEAERLERRISAADAQQRLAQQPQFSRVLARLELQGMAVPQRMRRLDAALTEEVVEARFDNIPV